MAGPAGLVFAATLLVGCAKPDPANPTATLAGSRWQLIAIESMDDRQTVYRVPDPSRYTLSFGADGQASFRLDCNQASAPWTGGRNTSGELRFGAFTMTRAVCPPPSMDRTVVRALPDVNAFRIVRGQLVMALEVNGGSYTWAPAPPSTTP